MEIAFIDKPGWNGRNKPIMRRYIQWKVTKLGRLS